MISQSLPASSYVSKPLRIDRPCIAQDIFAISSLAPEAASLQQSLPPLAATNVPSNVFVDHILAQMEHPESPISTLANAGEHARQRLCQPILCRADAQSKYEASILPCMAFTQLPKILSACSNSNFSPGYPLRGAW